jgi:HAT1-interacting factor 1
MVLDLTPGRLSDSIVHAEKALESVETRLAELRDGLNGQLVPIPREEAKEPKGKEKSWGSKLIRDSMIQEMSKAQIEGEIKELEGLRGDLALKVRTSRSFLLHI